MVRKQLTESDDKLIAERSRKIFASATNPVRAKVVADYRDALQLKADLAAGKTVFAAVCSVCHKVDDAEGGNAIGPDLAALTDRSPEAMLVAILDPNRAVEDKFTAYSVVTREGSQLFGLIGDENANSITLRDAAGGEHQILRADIKTMKSPGISLMPDGLEATMTKQQIADVIAYIGTLGGGSNPQPDPALSGRVGSGRDGIIELKASNSRISGERIEYMNDFDAIGWWTSADDRVEWTVVLDRPGKYKVEWVYSVSDKAAGNSWQILLNGNKALGGKIQTTGSWETFQTQAIGEVELQGGDTKVVLKSDGPVDQALMDLRVIRLLPMKKEN